MDKVIQRLIEYGLTETEAQKFIAMIQIMEIPPEDVHAFYEEIDAEEEGFIGGPSVSEAIIAIRTEIEPEYHYPEDRVIADEDIEEEDEVEHYGGYGGSMMADPMQDLIDSYSH
jgi:hypothetical protein